MSIVNRNKDLDPWIAKTSSNFWANYVSYAARAADSDIMLVRVPSRRIVDINDDIHHHRLSWLGVFAISVIEFHDSLTLY